MFVSAYLLVTAGCASQSGNDHHKRVKSQLDTSSLSVSGISKASAIHVHQFTTNRINLDSDTSQSMANSAPHLLASDIVYTLRAAGFTNVTLDESAGGAKPGSINLVGALRGFSVSFDIASQLKGESNLHIIAASSNKKAANVSGLFNWCF